MKIEIGQSIAASITGTCASCHHEPAQCATPHDDDGALLFTCWRCAHLLTEHEATPATLAAERASCACPEGDIFPPPSAPAN